MVRMIVVVVVVVVVMILMKMMMFVMIITILALKSAFHIFLQSTDCAMNCLQHVHLLALCESCATLLGNMVHVDSSDTGFDS